MVTFTVITDDDNNYELSALLDDNNKYEAVSLKFNIDGKEVDLWDDEYSLYWNVYMGYFKQTHMLSEPEYDELDENFFDVKDEVLELFEEADKLGFFDHLKYQNHNETTN